MTTYIALLRGINVGGNKKVKMADLRDTIAGLGFGEVETLLQSGNVVFRGEPYARAELEALLGKETKERLGVQTEYLVRTAEEWEAVVAANPFPEEARSDPSHLLVYFLRESVDPNALAAVQAAVTGPEILKPGDETLYVVFPEGIGRSKLDRTPGYNKLLKTATARNWNTVLKIAEMAGKR